MRGAALVLLAAMVGSAVLAGCSQSPNVPAEVVVQSQATDEVHSNGTATAAAPEPKTRGHIAGVVVDEAIRPIAGARVKLPGLDLVRTTDRDGSFGFVDLRPGPYFITVNATGYYSAQTVLDVKEDEFTRAKVILTAIPPPEPYHVTQSFDGFADVVADSQFLTFGFTCSSCVFDFYVDRPGLRALVLEATAEGPVTGDGFEHWLYGDNESYGSGLSSGSSGVPMRVELRDGDLGDGDHFSLEVYPTAFPAPETSKRFQVFATAFYNQPPPTGWSLAQGDP